MGFQFLLSWISCLSQFMLKPVMCWGGPGPLFLFLCLVIYRTHDWDSLTIIMAAFLGSWAFSALLCLRKAYLLIFNFYVCAYLVVCVIQITQKYPVFEAEAKMTDNSIHGLEGQKVESSCAGRGATLWPSLLSIPVYRLSLFHVRTLSFQELCRGGTWSAHSAGWWPAGFPGCEHREQRPG